MDEEKFGSVRPRASTGPVNGGGAPSPRRTAVVQAIFEGSPVGEFTIEMPADPTAESTTQLDQSPVDAAIVASDEPQVGGRHERYGQGDGRRRPKMRPTDRRTHQSRVQSRTRLPARRRPRTSAIWNL
jgi:hypothetical protein